MVVEADCREGDKIRGDIDSFDMTDVNWFQMLLTDKKKTTIQMAFDFKKIYIKKWKKEENKK